MVTSLEEMPHINRYENTVGVKKSLPLAVAHCFPVSGVSEIGLKSYHSEQVIGSGTI